MFYSLTDPENLDIYWEIFCGNNDFYNKKSLSQNIITKVISSISFILERKPVFY